MGRGEEGRKENQTDIMYLSIAKISLSCYSYTKWTKNKPNESSSFGSIFLLFQLVLGFYIGDLKRFFSSFNNEVQPSFSSFLTLLTRLNLLLNGLLLSLWNWLPTCLLFGPWSFLRNRKNSMREQHDAWRLVYNA